MAHRLSDFPDTQDNRFDHRFGALNHRCGYLRTGGLDCMMRLDGPGLGSANPSSSSIEGRVARRRPHRCVLALAGLLSDRRHAASQCRNMIVGVGDRRHAGRRDF